MNIQVYTTGVQVDLEDNSVVIDNVDLGNLVAQIKTTDILEALQANDEFSVIHDWVIKELNSEN